MRFDGYGKSRTSKPKLGTNYSINRICRLWFCGNLAYPDDTVVGHTVTKRRGIQKYSTRRSIESNFNRGNMKENKKMQVVSDYDYVMSISDRLCQYEGKWIIVYDNEILYSDEDLTKIYKKFKDAYPDKNPFVMKISKEPNMLF